MAGDGKRRARKKRISGKEVRARLSEAEATLDAIRTGRVDALVVSGPQGEQTRTIEGATHPYFVLLNAMSDGAALLERGGAILFGNLSLGDIVGARVETLLGSPIQRLVAPAELSRFDEFLRLGCAKKSAAETSPEPREPSTRTNASPTVGRPLKADVPPTAGRVRGGTRRAAGRGLTCRRGLARARRVRRSAS